MMKKQAMLSQILVIELICSGSCKMSTKIMPIDQYFHQMLSSSSSLIKEKYSIKKYKSIIFTKGRISHFPKIHRKHKPF